MPHDTPLTDALRPPLDPGFEPATLWMRAFRAAAAGSGRQAELALERPDGAVYRHRLPLLPDAAETRPRNLRALERTVKFLLWQKGAATLHLAGAPELSASLRQLYSPGNARAFDAETIAEKVFLRPLAAHDCAPGALPAPRDSSVALGGHTAGCRIGFDLGGSDRKCAAVIDGEAVFTEEIPWDPYFQSDPEYHRAGIEDSLQRAAKHLPRVDAIGGSAAGIYIDNEPRVASLFRGVPAAAFDRTVRPLFKTLRAAWNDVPFVVVNDGEVTALAGAMALQDNAILGIAMGTSQAVGYCGPDGRITSWLNELAFAPVDFREDAPVDEWSGDHGCGVQYFSQQAVARLAPVAGIALPDDLPFAERLVAVQERMAVGDERARRIYETIGAYLGWTIPWYADFYTLRHVLLLGRVTSGAGGAVIIAQAEAVLKTAFPALHEQVRISMPDETFKRHGQAVVAASLPAS